MHATGLGCVAYGGVACSGIADAGCAVVTQEGGDGRQQLLLGAGGQGDHRAAGEVQVHAEADLEKQRHTSK